jgi:cell division septation protein DedD
VKTRYIEDDDLDTASDREISLSPSTVLGIFFLLALICAVFFGFGYSMGRRSATPTAAAASASDNDSAPLKATGDAKPAPGQADKEDDPTPADAAAAESSRPEKAFTPPTPATVVADTRAQSQPRLQPAVARSVAPVAAPKLTPAVVTQPPAPRPVAGAAGGTPALVQIAAVSHQEDADILVNALKKRGYTVAVRHEPQDKLLHIQLGPFASRKDADAMRQHLIADGYNAIVK